MAPKTTAILAAQILAVGDNTVREQIRAYKKELAEQVESKDARLQAALAQQPEKEPSYFL